MRVVKREGQVRNRSQKKVEVKEPIISKKEALNFILNHNFLLTINFRQVNIIQLSQTKGEPMKIQSDELDNGICLIKLTGSLDIKAVSEIEIKFTAYCSGENRRVLVDLTNVDFLSSIGIRLLMINAKSIASRNGRIAILNPNENVKDVLEVTGIPSIIPIYEQMESAVTVLLR